MTAHREERGSKRAVVLAGGQGRRLLPYTSVLPKPLMPVGERPILEIVVGQLRDAGFDRVTIAVGHLASLIQAYFGNGERFGVAIDYSLEERPLGTAGPLAVLDPRPAHDVLVMNGDVLTDLDFGRFYRDHCASGAAATIAVYRKSVDIALGVLSIDERDRVTAYDEKPVLHFPVSTGIYCFHPRVLDHLEPGTRCDLPQLVHALLAAGETVLGAKVEGRWLDIGRPEDYEQAQRLAADGSVSGTSLR
jgi:NDP-sugar pyrophosphorylase family protein